MGKTQRRGFTRRGLIQAFAVALLALAMVLTTLPKNAFASTIGLMVMDTDDLQEVNGWPLIDKKHFTLHFTFGSSYSKNKYELVVARADTDEVVGTASNTIYVGSSLISTLDLSVNASSWDPGKYVVYAKTYSYTSYGWIGYEDNYNYENGYACGIFDYRSSIAGSGISLSKTSFTYNGKVQRPRITAIGGKKLRRGQDYTVTWSNTSSKNVGTYTIKVKGKGGYTGTSATATYRIVKAPNTITAKANVRIPQVKAGRTLKAKQVLTVKNAKGKVTYSKASGDKRITIDQKGTIKVKKGIKPGTYKVKIKVRAEGDSTYKAATKSVTVKIAVK